MRDRDPGVQAERTVLAWRRTLLALSAVVLLGARLAFTGRSPIALGLLIGLWGIGVFFGWRRMRALRRPPVAAARTIAVTGLCACLIAAVGAVLAQVNGGWR